jgi:tetratricopeptide (TPR) repeat protein
MRVLTFSILFIGGLFGWDSLPRQAQAHLEAGRFAEAIKCMEEAIGQYPGQRASLEFNIGQTWLKLDSIQRAVNWYLRSSANKTNPEVASQAFNNLGVLYNRQLQSGGSPTPPMQAPTPPSNDPLQQQIDGLDKSLEAFKSSLRKNSDNELARFNYELLKRQKQQLQQQQQQQQNQDQDQQKEEQQKEQKDNQQQNQPQNQQKSPQNTEGKGMEGKRPQIGMEEARQLLEAMKDNEKKFMQQLQKSKKRRPNQQDGPDW